MKLPASRRRPAAKTRRRASGSARPACRGCGSTRLKAVKPTRRQQLGNLLLPVTRLHCGQCDRDRVQLDSYLRPAIWAALLVGVFTGVGSMLPDAPVAPASSLTEISLSDHPSADEAMPAASIDERDIASVFLGQDGDTKAVAGGSAETKAAADPMPTNSGQVESDSESEFEVFAPIMSADGARFTIQLASAATWREADKMMVLFAQRYGMTDDFFVYRSQAGGKLLFPVLYGSYDSSRRAEEVIAELPQHLRSRQPFVRKFATVQRMLAQVDG